jgi:hypothetical protein
MMRLIGGGRSIADRETGAGRAEPCDSLEVYGRDRFCPEL